MAKFNEVWDQLSKANREATKDKKSKNVAFSRGKQNVLTQAILNDSEYTAEIIKSKGDEFITVEQKPVEEFRKQFVSKVLRDNGIDRQQADDAAKNYEFTKAQAAAFDEVARESVEQFLRAGFVYKFNDKKDFSSNIRMKDVEEKIVEGRVPGTDKVTKTKAGAHKALVKKGGAPKWAKTKLS